MRVYEVLLPVLLCTGALGQIFTFDNGVPDARCSTQDDPFNPTHLPHSRDCNKFMKCFAGRAYTLECPVGQEFGAHLNRCDYPEVAKCRSVMAAPEAAAFNYEAGIPDIRCPNPDDPANPVHLAHSTDCGKFMKCFDGKSYTIDCPSGQEFSVTFSRCDYPEVAKCNKFQQILPEPADFVYSVGVSDARCPPFDDPLRPVHMPNNRDCSKFFKCFDGRAYEINCPAGQEFGAAINRCDFPMFAQCSGRPYEVDNVDAVPVNWDWNDDDESGSDEQLTSEEMEIINGIVDIRCPPNDDLDHPIHLMHPHDCEKFYKCYNGRAYMIKCPIGQHWSVKHNRCDYPQVAKCKARPLP